MSPTYTLHEVTTRAESDAIVDLAWVAWREPYISSFQLFHPVHGPTAQDHDAAVLADKERAWNTNLAYKEGVSHWIYVVDQSNGAVIGACQVIFLLSIDTLIMLMLDKFSGPYLQRRHGPTSSPI